MFKRVLTIAVLVAGIGCFAASGVRIDINALSSKIALAPGKASKGLKVVNGSWMKDNSKYYLMAYSPMNLTDKWQKFSFSFTPDADGIVKIHLRGSWHKPKGAPKNIALWTAYDNITITGTEAKNCDFEFVNQKNMFNGWTGSTANMVIGKEDAQSGKNYVIAWHNNPVYQTLKLKKGEEVTVTFFAKTSEGPVRKKSDMENI